MLKRYLKTRQDNLTTMVNVRQQMQAKVDQEQMRLNLLQQHIGGMQKPANMSCSMSMLNASEMRNALSKMEYEQQARIELARSELSRQQQACTRQAQFNLGIEKLIERRDIEAQKIALSRQQKRDDELATQFALRDRSSI